nr:blue copper protein-like [Ipomoea trifida]
MATRIEFAAFVVLLAAVVATMLPETTNAATLVVGDTTGWTVPPSTSTYSDWASRQTIKAPASPSPSGGTPGGPPAPVPEANTPGGTPTAPPPPSSAPTTSVVATFVVVAMSIAIGVVC